MKIYAKFLIGSIFFLFSSQLFSQTYFNVQYSGGSQKTIDISQLSNITFSGTSVTYTLTISSTLTDDISTISNITFGTSNGGSPLPVELVNFVATTNQKTATLTWSTATEVNNYGFEVQRLADNIWTKIGFVQGHGNSNSLKNYSFTDSSPLAGKIQYRLKQIDIDGKYKYSNTVEVTVAVPATYALKQNFPNPFNPSTKIKYDLPIDGLVTLKIYDVFGREFSLLFNENKRSGSYEVIFDGKRLASGIYICKMKSGNYSNIIKMLMLK